MHTKHRYALPMGEVLHNVYRIQQVLGAGAFGITYLVEHINLHSPSVIKEYFPEFAIRQDGQVQPPNADHAELFNWGLSRFFQEAQTLNKLNHPNIVKVSDLFKENGTAYFVMPYMGSRTLLNWIESHSTPSVADLETVFLPILDGLHYIHERNLLHRDIKPANILLQEDNTPVLIDFGSARFVLDSASPMTRTLTPNFAPIEQYGHKSEQYTPALDIYSFAACLYQAITRSLPEAAPDRIPHDTQMKLADNAAYRQLYPVNWLAAIDKGLNVYANERFQAALSMKEAFVNPHTVSSPLPLHTTVMDAPETTQMPPQPHTTEYTPPPSQAKPTPKSKPEPKIKPTAQTKSSGSLKKLFGRVVMLGIFGAVGLGAYPFVKTWLSKPPVDKPYRSTVELTLGKRKVQYTGWLLNGVAEDNTGTAQLKFDDGTTCTVGMSNNKRHGTGTCVYPKGSVYEGAWKDDMKHGYGKYTPTKTSPILTYEGGFVQGKFSGKGMMKYKNGAVFVGEFAKDNIKTNGKGEMTGMLGMNARCEGTFTATYANCQFKQGNSVIKFKGEHKNGLWHGKGELITLDNNIQTDHYRGVFRNGDMVKVNKSAPEPSEADTPPETIEEVTADTPPPAETPVQQNNKDNVNNLF